MGGGWLVWGDPDGARADTILNPRYHRPEPVFCALTFFCTRPWHSRARLPLRPLAFKGFDWQCSVRHRRREECQALAV